MRGNVFGFETHPDISHTTQSFAGMAELVNALDSNAEAILGEQSAVAVWLPVATTLVPAHRIALESPILADDK